VPAEPIESSLNPGSRELFRDAHILPADTNNQGPYVSPQAALILAAVVAVAFVAISGRSLWIDEACTAMKALEPNLSGWWQVMVREKTADIQMPFYMLYVWGWARVFGTGEWSLHLANLPWFALGAIVFILSFSATDRSRKIAACVAMLCPFAWYYLDEARPYAMQLGAGLLIVGSIRWLLQMPPTEAPRGLPLAGFLMGVIVLSGSSLLGMVWAVAAVLALPVLLSKQQLVCLLRRHWNMLLIAAAPLLLLAVFYVWTLKTGARASAAATTTAGSTFFAIYELLGFTGMGPGRLEMRSAGPAALHGHLLSVGFYGLTTALVIGAALTAARERKDRRQFALMLCCSLPPVFILAVGCVAHFRVLGRHLAPFVPIWLLLLTSGLATLWAQKNAAGRALVTGFCVLSLFSCLSVRFSPRHDKDNYRAAAAAARTALASGQAVWWNAAEEGARYYGLPVTEHPESGPGALFLMNPARQTLDTLPAPRLIVASKPDVYDGQQGMADYIRDHGFSPTAEYAAFVLWEKTPK
jgi:hypothetical protein